MTQCSENSDEPGQNRRAECIKKGCMPPWGCPMEPTFQPSGQSLCLYLESCHAFVHLTTSFSEETLHKMPLSISHSFLHYVFETLATICIIIGYTCMHHKILIRVLFQVGNQCWCSNTLGMYGAIPDAECARPCTGDKKKTCGDRNANSVYAGTCNIYQIGLVFLKIQRQRQLVV